MGGASRRASSSSVACVLGVRSRVFRNSFGDAASNVGPTPSRRGKTDVRRAGPPARAEGRPALRSQATPPGHLARKPHERRAHRDSLPLGDAVRAPRTTPYARRDARVVAHQPPRPVQPHRPVDALERARARRRPAVGVADRVADLAGGQHAAGPGDRRHAAGQVDRAPVPVAGAAERRARGHADAQLREVLALGVGRVDEVEREREHRVRVGADEHRGVADRLDQAHVAAQALGGELDQAVGDAAELVGRDLLAQAGEADEVGEAHRDLARARAARPPGARRR